MDTVVGGEDLDRVGQGGRARRPGKILDVGSRELRQSLGRQGLGGAGEARC